VPSLFHENSSSEAHTRAEFAEGGTRAMTSERLVRIFEPVHEEIAACKELLDEILGEHEVERKFPTERVRQAARGLGEAGDVSFHLVRDMAFQLRRMQGKWIRAAVVLLSGKAFECRREDAVRAACALELIHLATLIHDDIIDEAETRRGYAALPRTHGESASVLMGDLLYAKAMRLILETKRMPVLEAVTASVEQVCLGEIFEHQFSWESPPTEADYMDIIRRKTASLIECCARSGCLLSGRDGEWVERLGEFGLNLGMAFQITDDILDITADGESLGKDLGADLRNGNITLPIIHLAAQQVETPLKALVSSGDGSGPRLLRMLEESGSLDYARTTAQAFASRAEESLASIQEEIPHSKELDSLKALARLVVDRGY
jgi:geranylgeranyl pyrophosphate synthase